MFGAVDIGGTKTLVAVSDGKGKIIEQQKFPTPKDYEEFKIELAKVVAELSTKDFNRIVMAVPGLLNRKKGIALSFGNLPWESIPIQADAENIFNCPVMIENDANLAGLSEAILVLKEFKKTLYVTISTGIGTGIIVNGVIDPNFEDTEGGQLLLEHEGKFVIWEDFASGRAIKNKYGKLVSEIKDNDPAWYTIAHNIAIGLINLISIVTPEVVILGGGVSAHLEKFQDRLVEDLKIYENPLVKIPPLRQAQRSEEAVIYGCYEYAKQHHEKLNS